MTHVHINKFHHSLRNVNIPSEITHTGLRLSGATETSRAISRKMKIRMCFNIPSFCVNKSS